MEERIIKSFGIAWQAEMRRRLHPTTENRYCSDFIWLSHFEIPSHIHIESDFYHFARSLKFKSKVHRNFAFYCFKYGYLNAVNLYFEYKEEEELYSLFFDFCANSDREIYPNGYTQAFDWFTKGYKLALYQKGKFILSAINDNICNRCNLDNSIRLPYNKQLDNEFEGLAWNIDPELQLPANKVKNCYCAIAFKIGRLLSMNVVKAGAFCFLNKYFHKLFVEYFGKDEYVLTYFDWFKAGIQFS